MLSYLYTCIYTHFHNIFYSFSKFILFQTVKCLLIMPNAESALNEEAGKLLLEHYDDYFARAKMMTEIHAQVIINFYRIKNSFV